MTTINESVQFKFLQSQIQYYSSHLSLADVKAGGIMAFAVAVSGVTAKEFAWDKSLQQLFPNGFAWLGLLLALVAMVCAFCALWPRYRSAPAPHGLFGWVDVSANARAEKKNPRHAKRVKAASSSDLLNSIATTIEDLAGVIAQKYRWIKRATWALAPATAAHIFFWVGA